MIPHLTIADAAAQIRLGRLVVYPTETVFGLGASPYSEIAVDTLLQVKDRSNEQGIPLIVDTTERVEELLAPESKAQQALRLELQQAFWPGPLTIVIQPSSGVSTRLARGIAAVDGSIAVRLSSHSQATRLAHATGGILTSTSANPRGKPAVVTEVELRAYFPDLPLIAGSCDVEGKPLPSTIVDVRSETLRVVRLGCISEAELAVRQRS